MMIEAHPSHNENQSTLQHWIGKMAAILQARQRGLVESRSATTQTRTFLIWFACTSGASVSCTGAWVARPTATAVLATARSADRQRAAATDPAVARRLHRPTMCRLARRSIRALIHECDERQPVDARALASRAPGLVIPNANGERQLLRSCCYIQLPRPATLATDINAAAVRGEIVHGLCARRVQLGDGRQVAQGVIR
jgi:hypothetical protein